MAEWRETTLGDLGAEGTRGFAAGPFGSAVSSKNFVSSGVPMIRGSNLSDRIECRLREEDLVYLPEHLTDRFPRSIAKAGDLVFTCWGTIGQVGYISPDAGFSEYLVSNKQMRMTPDRSAADPVFLYYLLSQPLIVNYIKSEAIGSSVPGFNLGQLRSLRVRVPKVRMQRAIADVLGALDDKIAAHAKLATTADDLVRSRFEDLRRSSNELVELGDLVDNVRELVEPNAASGVYVGLEHVPRRNMWLNARGDVGEVTSTKARFRSSDVLFGKLRPYFHKVVSAPTAGVCSTDILVLRPRDPSLAGLALAAASSDETIATVNAASEGTRMPRANWRDLAAIPVTWPGESAARQFSADVTALRDAIEHHIAENVTLAATRDALLPALMSGKLRVEEAAEVAGL